MTEKENMEKFKRFQDHLFSRTEETEKKTGCRNCGFILLSAVVLKEAVLI